MVGVMVLGSFLGMCLVRGAASFVIRHGDRVALRRQAGEGVTGIADEAQAWLDRGHPGPA